MNQLHPDSQYQIHRSYQNERLEKSLQEKPARKPFTFRFPPIIFVSVLIAVVGYIVIL